MSMRYGISIGQGVSPPSPLLSSDPPRFSSVRWQRAWPLEGVKSGYVAELIFV
jgi:hypothetical protein